jgi:hypothetical protein
LVVHGRVRGVDDRPRTETRSGGSEGQRSATAGPLASWTSDPIDVQAGKAYSFSADVAGTGGAVVVEQLSATGAVLSSVSELLPAAGDGLFLAVGGTFTTAAAATHVRVKLTVGLMAAPRSTTSGSGKSDRIRFGNRRSAEELTLVRHRLDTPLSGVLYVPAIPPDVVT